MKYPFNAWFTLFIFIAVALGSFATQLFAAERWSSEKANDWYEKQPWLVGCNYVPSSAINQLEMWQESTFDPAAIDREFGWASEIGFNTVRVFLHDLLWNNDREGFLKRFDQYLEIADRHGIKSMVVLFDGVWDPDPQLGPQNCPRAGIHNSGWVQSPGRYILADDERQDQLQDYVCGIIKTHANDQRIIVWDLFNEPDNSNAISYSPLELKNKDERAARLVQRSFAWARSVNPSQPMTVAVWVGGPWNDEKNLNQVHRAALELSDVISFHDYNSVDLLRGRIEQLKGFQRPILCTEFMARGNGSTFKGALPVFKEHRVAAYCWGLVDGKSQTKYPWPTWQMPLKGEPSPWHHDIFHADGRPYRPAETELIKSLTR